MLNTVKKLIADAPCITFEQYFQNYVMQVQDSAINEEVSFLLRNNFLSSNAVIKLINREIDRM